MTICGAASVHGASLAEDGNIISSSLRLNRVSEAGGKPDEILKPTQSLDFRTGPQILPGGQTVLFWADSGRNNRPAERFSPGAF